MSTMRTSSRTSTTCPALGSTLEPGVNFHECSGSTCRIAIFGTDFGTTKYWGEVQTRGCERKTQPTIRLLRKLIDEVAQETGVRDLANWCYLTNAVLAVAKCTNEVQGTATPTRRTGSSTARPTCGSAARLTPSGYGNRSRAWRCSSGKITLRSTDAASGRWCGPICLVRAEGGLVCR